MIAAGFSLLFLLSGVLLLRRHRLIKRPDGTEQDLLTDAVIRRDLQTPFLHQLAFALLGLSAAGLLLLKRPWVFLALSLTLAFLIACAHAEALLNLCSVRAGRYSIRRERANVQIKKEYGGTGSYRTVHIVSFGKNGNTGSFQVEDFPGYGLEFYQPGTWYELVMVKGKIARVYSEKEYRLDPDLAREK